MTAASPNTGHAFKSEFLRVMSERGYIHQQSHAEELDARAAAGPITAYIGFDATADSLHVGSLVQIMLLRRLQQTGHKPIVVMGGGTTKVGDPSGKDSQRQMLTDAQIQSNIARACAARSSPSSPSATAPPTLSPSITTSGSPSSAMWSSCGSTARTSPSTGC